MTICKEVHCSCRDWNENLSILNTPWMLGHTAVGGYSGKQFEFCPWCGKRLVKVAYSYMRIQGASQCNCGTPDFKNSTGGCPEHRLNKHGIPFNMV